MFCNWVYAHYVIGNQKRVINFIFGDSNEENYLFRSNFENLGMGTFVYLLKRVANLCPQ